MASPILAGLTILMLGDSHFATQGYLVTTLQDALIQQGAKVVTEAACGAPAGVWTEAGSAPCGTAERVQSGPIKKDHTEARPRRPIDELIGRYHPNLDHHRVGRHHGRLRPARPARPVDRRAVSRPDAAHPGGQHALRLDRARLGHRGRALLQDLRPGAGAERLPRAPRWRPAATSTRTKFAQPGEWPTFDGQHYTAARLPEVGPGDRPGDPDLAKVQQHRAREDRRPA